MYTRRRVLQLFSLVAVVFISFAYYRSVALLSSGDRLITELKLSMETPELEPTPDLPRVNATMIALVRNKELEGMVRSMRQLEETWNHRYNYPWTFFNDEPFTEEFKVKTQAATNAKCYYEIIPKEHWEIPDWVDPYQFQQSMANMSAKWVKYATLPSYHQMCRWYSGFFYKHPALKDMEFYWRVEPDVKFFCDIEYDVFRYMKDERKTYGFTINIHDDPLTIPSLWPETLRFLAQHPEYEHPHNSRGWLTDGSQHPDWLEQANGYSTCHFWSNFEIGNLNFWRSEVYEAYFEHLDRANGFFYERWGDAPVHSVALGLFEDSSKIHWFRDIGYQHTVFSNCPDSPRCQNCRTNRLAPITFWLNHKDCRASWFQHSGMG